MLYLIIEHFRDGDPVPMYRRLRDEGRLVPHGLCYVASWVTDDFRRCFQIVVRGRSAPNEMDRPLGGPDRVRGESGDNVGRSGGHTRASIVKCLRTVCPPHPFPWY